PFMIKSSRSLFEIKDEKNVAFVRDVAVLTVNGFSLPLDKISNSWLADELDAGEARNWLSATARITKTASYQPLEAANYPPSFSSGLIAAIYGETRADTLLNSEMQTTCSVFLTVAK